MAPLITDILDDGQYNNEMHNDWIQGGVTFMRKNKDPLKLGNYRPITLLRYTKYGPSYSATD